MPKRILTLLSVFLLVFLLCTPIYATNEIDFDINNFNFDTALTPVEVIPVIMADYNEKVFSDISQNYNEYNAIQIVDSSGNNTTSLDITTILPQEGEYKTSTICYKAVKEGIITPSFTSTVESFINEETGVTFIAPLFRELSDGTWFIWCDTDSKGSSEFYILDTSTAERHDEGSIWISPKISESNATVFVKEVDDSHDIEPYWTHDASADINDNIDFRMIVTLSDTLEINEDFIAEASLTSGLDIIQDSVKVYTTSWNYNKAPDLSQLDEKSFTLIDDSKYDLWFPEQTDGSSYETRRKWQESEMDIILRFSPSISEITNYENVIVVDFSATLNENAYSQTNKSESCIACTRIESPIYNQISPWSTVWVTTLTFKMYIYDQQSLATNAATYTLQKWIASDNEWQPFTGTMKLRTAKGYTHADGAQCKGYEDCTLTFENYEQFESLHTYGEIPNSEGSVLQFDGLDNGIYTILDSNNNNVAIFSISVDSSEVVTVNKVDIVDNQPVETDADLGTYLYDVGPWTGVIDLVNKKDVTFGVYHLLETTLICNDVIPTSNTLHLVIGSIIVIFIMILFFSLSYIKFKKKEENKDEVM